MHSFVAALKGGLARAARLRLALPLYLVGLALGLIQAWPTATALGAGPLLERLAAGDADALTLLAVADPDALTPVALLWVLGALGAALAFAGAYNFFSGGILSAWAGGEFWAGCRRYFWGFVGLGALLLLLTILALVAASIVGTAAGFVAAVITAVALIQLINLWGEYARAAAVAQGQANPLTAMGAAARVIAGRPLGVIALAALGLLLHLSISAAYSALGGRLGWGAPLIQQAAVFGWAWVKLLRLGWASAYMRQ